MQLGVVQFSDNVIIANCCYINFPSINFILLMWWNCNEICSHYWFCLKYIYWASDELCAGLSFSVLLWTYDFFFMTRRQWCLLICSLFLSLFYWILNTCKQVSAPIQMPKKKKKIERERSWPLLKDHISWIYYVLHPFEHFCITCSFILCTESYQFLPVILI